MKKIWIILLLIFFSYTSVLASSLWVYNNTTPKYNCYFIEEEEWDKNWTSLPLIRIVFNCNTSYEEEVLQLEYVKLEIFIYKLIKSLDEE